MAFRIVTAHIAPDHQRIQHIRRALRDGELDALVCALPSNVLLLSGYWPVVGTSLAVATREGRIGIVAPADEQPLAEHGWADTIAVFHPGSLDELRSAVDVVGEPLIEVARALNVRPGGRRIGYEHGSVFEPTSYAGMHRYQASLLDVLRDAFPGAEMFPADAVLSGLRSVKTEYEVDRIRAACAIAGDAFHAGTAALRAGLRETEAAALLRPALSAPHAPAGGARADGFVFCMSGPNAAHAYGAYARSGERELASGDLVLVHCNSYVDGYWTDITRTYSVGAPDERQRAMYDAVLAARRAALDAIRPGVTGAAVDAAARDVLRGRGFEGAFKHSTGHGVGFSAINHLARPRLHPKSDDILKPGMVCNVEPAIYIEGCGGLRHCDVVAVGATGAEVLTPFHVTLHELRVTPHGPAARAVR